MKPYYEQDGITIYCCDWREVRHLRGDVLLTDIPYGKVNRASGGLRNLDKGDADVLTFELGELCEFAANYDSAYVWCGTEQISTIRAGLVELGMTTRLCVWEKTNPSPMNGEKLWLSSIEACVFGRKGGAFFSERCASPVWRGPVVPNQIHPTQKPEWLFKRLIGASCPPGGVVVDCCAGSGTTLVAARDMGMKAIGIEINPDYCEIIRNRLRQGVLFGGAA